MPSILRPERARDSWSWSRQTGPMRSIWIRATWRCWPLWKRPTRTKRRRGARGARPSFKDAVARLADALAATVKEQGKLAQARNRLEAAARRTDTRGWVVARRERTRHIIELGGDRKSTRLNSSH